MKIDKIRIEKQRLVQSTFDNVVTNNYFPDKHKKQLFLDAWKFKFDTMMNYQKKLIEEAKSVDR